LNYEYPEEAPITIVVRRVILMDFIANCQTTAMGNMPHTDIESALNLALSLDMPFFPQLPKLEFSEDLYVLAADHFPGITINMGNESIDFSYKLFSEELPGFIENMESEDFLSMSIKHSSIYHAFLNTDLANFPAIRGQFMGPMSFGFRITDENKKPIIYNDAVREIIYMFFAKKINFQFKQLSAKNNNVYIWLDEPSMEILFGCFTGYTNLSAKQDYRTFLEMIEAPIGIHLCGNPDWSFLLSDMNIKMLSMNAYGCGSMFTKYYDEINSFLLKGNIIAWGIVPTLKKLYDIETIEMLEDKLETMWDYLATKGIDKQLLLEQSLLTPASCCMVNNDGGKTVEDSFRLLTELSLKIRRKYSLGV